MNAKLKQFGARMVCFVRDHDLGAMVRWSPDVTCLYIVCERCGKHLGHMDFPNVNNRNAPKEKMH